MTPRDSLLDDGAVIRLTRNYGYAPLEPIQFFDALGAANAYDLITAIQAMLDHVLPQLAGRANDTDLHDFRTTEN